MSKWFWSSMMFLLSILAAEAQELKIDKASATASGSCGETCNPISWESDFRLKNKAGKFVSSDAVFWRLEVKVKCDADIIESTITFRTGPVVFMRHSGEICKHSGAFSVVSSVKITNPSGKTIEETDFVHTPP